MVFVFHFNIFILCPGWERNKEKKEEMLLQGEIAWKRIYGSINFMPYIFAYFARALFNLQQASLVSLHFFLNKEINISNIIKLKFMLRTVVVVLINQL